MAETHNPHASVRAYRYNNVRPGVGAETIHCTVPGCNWSSTLAGKPAGRGVDEWAEHARQQPDSGLFHDRRGEQSERRKRTPEQQRNDQLMYKTLAKGGGK